MLFVHLVDRDTARRVGMKRFFTGKPCIRGGIGERRVSTMACCCDRCREHKRGSRSEYAKKWYAENRDYWKKKVSEYREDNKERVLASQRKWYEENRQLALDRCRDYYRLNKEAAAKSKRDYYVANRDSYLHRAAEYRRKNPTKLLELGAKRRAAKVDRTLSVDCELMNLVAIEAYSLAVERKEQTGIEWHVDHMLPLRGDDVSGLHVWNNLQVIPATLNLRKNNSSIYTEPFEWLKDA